MACILPLILLVSVVALFAGAVAALAVRLDRTGNVVRCTDATASRLREASSVQAAFTSRRTAPVTSA